MSYKYACLCHKSRVLSSSFALLSITHLPLKLEVTLCVQAVISPLLANVYLHYVFDLWAENWRKKVARGDMILVRYADDLVVGFQHRAEAERFLREFQERLAKFGLEIHPEMISLL